MGHVANIKLTGNAEADRNYSLSDYKMNDMVKLLLFIFIVSTSLQTQFDILTAGETSIRSRSIFKKFRLKSFTY